MSLVFTLKAYDNWINSETLVFQVVLFKERFNNIKKKYKSIDRWQWKVVSKIIPEHYLQINKSKGQVLATLTEVKYWQNIVSNKVGIH